MNQGVEENMNSTLVALYYVFPAVFLVHWKILIWPIALFLIKFLLQKTFTQYCMCSIFLIIFIKLKYKLSCKRGYSQFKVMAGSASHAYTPPQGPIIVSADRYAILPPPILIVTSHELSINSTLEPPSCFQKMPFNISNTTSRLRVPPVALSSRPITCSSRTCIPLNQSHAPLEKALWWAEEMLKFRFAQLWLHW